MRRLRTISLFCMLAGLLGVHISALCGGEPAALAPFAAVGYAGCAGMAASGAHALCLWAKARRRPR